MKKKTLFDFIIIIPFVVAVFAFIMYFRYFFAIKATPSKVTQIMEVSLVRYRNIGIFCLAVGVFLLFIKSIYDFYRINKVVEVRNDRVLDRISSKKNHEVVKLSFDENNIINDLLCDKNLKLKLFNSKFTDRVVKFKSYNNNKNIIEFYDLTNDEIVEEKKQEEIKYDKRYFTKCSYCENVIAKDAPICVHCGKVLREEKIKEKKSLFNPVKFALNMILILLCIILILLCLNKITNQSKLNRKNLNINNITNIRK